VNLARRVTMLERQRVDAKLVAAVCPDCGRMANGQVPNGALVRFTASFDHEGPEHCPTCGARVVLTLEFDHPDEEFELKT
jgi:predicted RNA-binding Zn-ribbon protein involved in translation (DUF1610 family)